MSDLQIVLSTDGAAVDFDRLGLTDAWLERLYEALATTRAVDARAEKLRAEGEIGFYVASIGLEAVAVGAALGLEDDDWLFPSHRDLGMYLLRGGSIRSWFDQLFGNADDLAGGRQLPGRATLPGGRFVTVSGRVGTQITHAVGCAMAMKRRAVAACALASFGEAAAGGGDFHAAIDIAARFRVPAVLLCRSGRRPDGAAVGRARPLAERARAHGLAAARVDGGDALAVYQAVCEARATAVQGGGTTLIEAVVDDDALFGSVGLDDGGVASEDARSAAHDPVARVRAFLEDGGQWNAAREEELQAELRQRIDEAVAGARSTPAADAAGLFDDVYESMTWVQQEQKEKLRGGDG